MRTYIESPEGDQADGGWGPFFFVLILISIVLAIVVIMNLLMWWGFLHVLDQLQIA
jgi:hypothetical protein